MQWQTFDPACQLTDQLSEYGMRLHAEPPASADAMRPARILFYGDSVDRTMVGDICNIGKGDWKECIVDQPTRAPRLSASPRTYCCSARARLANLL